MRIPAIPTSLMIGIVALVVLLAMVLMPRHARADPRTDCPTPAPCKVITLSPDEERVLIGQNMLLDTAVQGRQIDMFGPAAYFRQKIAGAPAGDVPKPAEQPAASAPKQ